MIQVRIYDAAGPPPNLDCAICLNIAMVSLSFCFISLKRSVLAARLSASN